MEQQLLCPLCSQQYSTDNPPRTIQCGHSICQSCIKQALNNKTKKPHTLTCPQDEEVIQLKNATINQFPKNLALIKLMKAHFAKKEQQSSSVKSLDESNIANKAPAADDQQDQQIINTINQTTKQTEAEKTGVTLSLEDLCLIHEKPLEIVCIQDKTKICSSCAIFGKHKGHQFKSLEQVQKDKLQACDQILQVIQKKQSLQILMNSNEAKQRHMNQLKDRRQLLTKQIKDKFSRLSEIISLAEKKAIQKLSKTFQGIIPQISELKFSDKTNKQYEEWAEEAFKYIKAFQSNDLQQQLQLLNYEKNEGQNVVENGTKVLKVLTKQYQQISDRTNQIIKQTVVVEYKSQIDCKLSTYCNITTKQQKQKEGSQNKLMNNKSQVIEDKGRNSLLPINPSKQKESNHKSLNTSRAQLQEIKISRIDPIPSDTQEPFLSPHSSISHKIDEQQKEKEKQLRKLSDHNDDLLIEEHKSEQKIEEDLAQTKIEIPSISHISSFQFGTDKQFSSTHNSSRKIQFSPIGKQRSQHNQSMTGSFIKHIGTKKIPPLKGNIVPAPVTKRKTKLKLPEKYDKIYNSILLDTAQIADFTNGQLGDAVIFQILQAMRGTKVKTLKLIRNKITDQGMDKVWDFLQNVITLNLSQNLLTDRFIDQLLHNLHKLPNLRSVILSQNKIRQRNVKNKIEQIKKQEITVSI